MVESLLEGVYVYSGLPWWASIVITAVVVRTCMFPLYVNAADVGARMAIVRPHIKPIQDRVQAARIAGDQAASMAALQEINTVYRNAGIQWTKSLWPLIQVPLGFGTFRLMRGMAALPVPGLESQGVYWLKDLTIPDPYYIMPLATAWVFYYTFKVNRNKAYCNAW